MKKFQNLLKYLNEPRHSSNIYHNALFRENLLEILRSINQHILNPIHNLHLKESIIDIKIFHEVNILIYVLLYRLYLLHNPKPQPYGQRSQLAMTTLPAADEIWRAAIYPASPACPFAVEKRREKRFSTFFLARF